MGEAHSEVADQRFREAVEAVRAAGRPVIAVLETPSTPKLDQMISDFQSGRMTETEFLDAGAAELHSHYMSAYNATSPAGAERDPPVDAGFWRNRLMTDVVQYQRAGIPVALVDTGRFVPGSNRDAIMAENMQRIADANPEAVLMAQLGIVHTPETSGLDLIPEEDINAGTPNNVITYKGAVKGKSDEDQPTAERLAVANGGRAVFTVAFDDLQEDKEGQYFQFMVGGLETEETDYGKFLPINSFDAVVPSWDPNSISGNPNEPAPSIQDVIPVRSDQS